MSDHDKHLTEYLVLFLGISFIAVFFYMFKYSETAKIVIALIGSAFYILWGIIHHALEGRLTRELVVEYTLFGVLAFVLIFTAIKL